MKRRTIVCSFAGAVILTVIASTAAGQTGSVTGAIRDVVVVSGDTLRSIGSRNGVDPATIARDNHLSVTAKLRVGQLLRVDARHISPDGVMPGTIVVNIPQRMLFLGGENATKAWPVAAGRRSWPTPLGSFTVVTKEEHPTWDVPASILEEARRSGVVLPPSVPPGPNNPLGDYWLGLSLPAVGIHGTNAPTSIYQLVTHGCIRMHPESIAQLFPEVTIGMRGTLAYQPILVALDGSRVLLEVHPDGYGRGPRDSAAYARTQITRVAGEERIDWVRVAAVLAERAGVPRVISFPVSGRGQPD